MPTNKQARTSVSASIQYIVFNERDQPVELHYEGKVVIIPPRGRAELEQADLDSIQFQNLHSRGLLTARPVSNIIPEQAPAREPAVKRKPRPRRAVRT